ncbi:vitamin B12-dependent ribonucleotide reductase [Candidatus Woesebacteria bacterium]|nr:vitamin B12-dependent ribonucleotide reductase [Candidatus Woesebacteria bacterium]
MPKRKTKTIKKNNEVTLESLNFPSYEEVIKEIRKKVGKRPKAPKTLPDGEWSEQALRVLHERYLSKDIEGKVVETPKEMCWRVSWEVASAEARWGATRSQVKDLAKQFYGLLVTHEFLPGSPTLMNAGTDNGLQYSSCFVLPVDDSLVGIFDAIKYQAIIHQTGGGTGFSFSRLRPAGSTVKSSGGVASGPVSFMKIFDAATNEIKQGGRRRGANMGILRVDHPDIMKFIKCKDEGGITNFNISVAITDKFMKAYEKGEDYALIDPRSGEETDRLDAKAVFDEIAKGAWRTGDPGVVFLDRMNNPSSNPVPSIGPVEATNPCGEQPLYPYDACNLGSIFLKYFVKEKDGERQVDWEKIKKVTALGIRFLDDVIEVNPFPLDDIRRTVSAIRRVGLGIGGWADMLVDLNIAYDSEEALKLGEKVMRTVNDEAIKTTEKLTKKRGAFPLFPQSIYKNGKKRRNSTVTTIAPTGSISIIANASSGVEPLYAIAYQHIVKDRSLDRTLTFVNPMFEKRMIEEGLWSDELREVVAERGVVREIADIPKKIRNVFGTAHEIHHDWHIKMQAAFQKHTENAVSKTINMVNEVTDADIKEAYLLAWKTGCKGVTVFRDGCKDMQVLNTGVKDRDVKKEADLEPAIIRPYKITGATYRLSTPVGTGFFTINTDQNGEPMEVFINIGKAGSDVQAMAEALGRVISISLRFRGALRPIERAQEIALQLAGIGGRRSVGFGPNKILSLPDAVALSLATHFGFKVNGFQPQLLDGKRKLTANGEVEDGKNGIEKTTDSGSVQAAMSALGSDNLSGSNHLESDHDRTAAFAEPGSVENSIVGKGDICPSCGQSSLIYQEGCAKCYSCAYSEC